MDQRIESFEEFWPQYVRAHSKKLTRQIHCAGTALALACVAGGVLTKRRWLFYLAPIAAYGPAWLSHWLVEGNHPTSFEHPIWSARADLLMCKKMLEGTMDAEAERILSGDFPEEADQPGDEQGSQPPLPGEGTVH
ncbi:MAG TPA: DUF962 domain-containing protein [Polyangiaceae bacterium]|jgi:hypothetical protein